MALSSSSLQGRTGEEPSGAGGGPIRALCASAAARGRGERRRVTLGFDSPPQFQRRGARGEEHGGHGRGESAAAVGGAVEVARGGCRQGKREAKGPSTYLDPWFG